MSGENGGSAGGGQASLRGVEPPMGGAPYSRAGSSSPLSPCANAHRRIGKDHSADEWPDAFVIDV